MKSHDRSHDGRGRHRRAASPEAKKWRELERQLDSVLHLKDTDPRKPKPKKAKKKITAPPPAQPVWLDDESYRLLLEMKAKL